MMAAFAQASADDLSLLVPLAIAVMGVVLYLFLGGIRPTLILFLLGLLAAVAAMGVAGWLDHKINNATSIVPVIILTLVIASAMHVMLHFQRSVGNAVDPEAVAVAAKASFENNLPPLTISAATSIVSLLSLSLVDSPPLQQLGQLSALGVLLGYVLSITILPLLLSAHRSRFSSRLSSSIQQLLNVYARQIEGRKTYFALSLVVAVTILSGIWRIEIDDNFVNYFDESTQFRSHTDRATVLLSGPNHIEVLVRTDKPAGVFDPEYLQFVETLAHNIRANTHVSNVHSYFDIINSVIRAVGVRSENSSLTSEENCTTLPRL